MFVRGDGQQATFTVLGTDSRGHGEVGNVAIAVSVFILLALCSIALVLVWRRLIY